MKKKATVFILSLLILIAGHFLLRIFLGFSPMKIGDALQVATGMGAKLACSAYFISGQSQQQILEDLASYSPVNSKLSITYNDEDKHVSASLFGLKETSARYRKSLGCTLDIGDTSPLDNININTNFEQNHENLAWPRGNKVTSIQQETQSAIDNILTKDNLQGLDTRALLVVQDNTIIAESYADGVDIDTPLLGWSMAKSLTAVLLGRMEYLELANMNASSIFPQWQADDRATISLENLLHMSSGLAFDETYAPGSDATDMLFGSASASDIVLAKKLGRESGTHFSYSSGTSNLLMRWMHDQLGGTSAMVNFLYRELYEPLGMVHTIVEPDPSGVLVGSSYMYASARDWARLGLLMLNRGTINGQRLLSEAWVERATAANSSKNKPNYGYHFWLNHKEYAQNWPQLPEDAYLMTGNRKQYVMIAPSHNMVVVRLGWTKGRYPLQENLSSILATKSENVSK